MRHGAVGASQAPVQAPAGSLVALLPDGCMLLLVNVVDYEVGDGDLILTTREGRVRAIPARLWSGIGTLHFADGLGYVAIGATAQI